MVLVCARPTEELSQMVSAAVKRHGTSVSETAEAYVVGVLHAFLYADSLFITPAPDETDTGRHLEPFVFQIQKAAEKPSLFKHVGDQCLFSVGFCYDSLRDKGAAYVDYHRTVGMLAYNKFARVFPTEGKPDSLFLELAASFDGLAAVVGDLHLPELTDSQRFLDVYERFLRTHDPRYATLLEAKGIQPHVKGELS